jgi:hypothetical protein
MASYQIYVRDDRRPTPTLRLTLVTEEARLKQIARFVLAESDHYRAVEIFDQDGHPFAHGAARPDVA